MKSQSFAEYVKLPKIENRLVSGKGTGRLKDRASFLMKPRGYSEIMRRFQIERGNQLLLEKLIHIANRKNDYKHKSVSVGKGKMRKRIADFSEISRRNVGLKKEERKGSREKVVRKSGTNEIIQKLGMRKTAKKEERKTEFSLEDDSSLDEYSEVFE